MSRRKFILRGVVVGRGGAAKATWRGGVYQSGCRAGMEPPRLGVPHAPGNAKGRHPRGDAALWASGYACTQPVPFQYMKSRFPTSLTTRSSAPGVSWVMPATVPVSYSLNRTQNFVLECRLT